MRELPVAAGFQLILNEDSDPQRDVDTNVASAIELASDLENIRTIDASSMTAEEDELDGSVQHDDGYEYSDFGLTPSRDGCKIPSSDLDAKHGIDAQANLNSHMNALQNFRLSSQPAQPKFFWEQNNWLGQVFGKRGSVVDDLFSSSKFPRVDGPLLNLTAAHSEGDVETLGPKAPLATAQRTKPFYLNATSKTTVEDVHATRLGLCTEWVNIVLVNWEAFEFSKMLMGNNRSISRAEILDSMMSAMAPKATSTLSKRLSSMSRFVLWCVKNGRGLFPLEEPSLYDYLKHLKAMPKSSPSSGKAFLEALRFAGDVLGLKSDEYALRSTRVSGLAEELARSAPVVVQADALTVMQVCKLERMIKSTPSVCDRVLLGGMLALLYSCGRASDGDRTVRILWDVVDESLLDRIEGPPGFIELGVLASKGAKSLRLRRQLLPLIIPMVSVSGVPWWEHWAKSRKDLDMGVEGELDFPLLPGFTTEGKPTMRSMCASEIGKLLRDFLGVAHMSRNVIRSHSLKATILSWMAKFGSPLPLRRLAGHHLDSTSKSPETYSRDCMAPVMMEISKILQQIGRQQFLPDATRSGRFVRQASQHEKVHNVESADDGESDAVEDGYDAGDDGHSTDESSDAGGPQEECDEIPDSTPLLHFVPTELRPYLVVVDPSLMPWRNKTSLVVHLAKMGDERLLCGRQLGASYVMLATVYEDSCRCKMCFTNQNAGKVMLNHGGNAPCDDV